MLIPPRYILTPKISELLASIEASRAVIDSMNIPIEIENNIRRASTLKSSLFSARIEGNDLTLNDLGVSSSKSQKKTEVFNILRALNLLKKKNKKDLNLKEVLEYHRIIMTGLSDQAGKFRTEPSAIFNAAGLAVYLNPSPKQFPSLLTKLINYTKSPKQTFAPIKACLTHYTFEKIHPFLDGNGRVGRLVMQHILNQEGYGMKGLLPIEEFLDNHRSLYYRVLENTPREVTDFVEFMLEAIAETANNTKTLIQEKQKLEVTDFLLPRRAEIYNIIKDHKIINFDIIRRRFMTINERTLRYDLKKLQDQGLIVKLGNTKGVFYQLANDFHSA